MADNDIEDIIQATEVHLLENGIQAVNYTYLKTALFWNWSKWKRYEVPLQFFSEDESLVLNLEGKTGVIDFTDFLDSLDDTPYWTGEFYVPALGESFEISDRSLAYLVWAGFTLEELGTVFGCYRETLWRRLDRLRNKVRREETRECIHV